MALTRTEERVNLPEFDTFFRRTFEGVARASALVARDPGTGQELAQEAFFRLYERWSEMQSEEHARRFAYRVAINLARSHVRKHLRLVLVGLEPFRKAPEPMTDRAEDWLEVRIALSGLSSRQRATVVLVDLVGMGSEEAGKVLGISAGTVRAHLMRGRRTLRERLGMPSGEADR
jgi:RNA polymerase sigma-70 factor (ECF subfamily)